MDEKINELIQSQMLKSKGNQMTKEEYWYISSFLGDKNFLVFGLGYDSKLWRYANRNGFTIFLEHDPRWITDDSDVYQVFYTTKLTQADDLLLEYRQGNFKNLTMNLPDIVLENNWDYIFVDSPQGYKPHFPGRMQSIYTASILANNNTHVFVHDCNRRVEDIYTREMFPKIVKQLTKLRHLN
jgi:uncharacterized protein (TIGR01627 family)